METLTDQDNFASENKSQLTLQKENYNLRLRVQSLEKENTSWKETHAAKNIELQKVTEEKIYWENKAKYNAVERPLSKPLPSPQEHNIEQDKEGCRKRKFSQNREKNKRLRRGNVKSDGESYNTKICHLERLQKKTQELETALGIANVCILGKQNEIDNCHVTIDRLKQNEKEKEAMIKVLQRKLKKCKDKQSLLTDQQIRNRREAVVEKTRLRKMCREKDEEFQTLKSGSEKLLKFVDRVMSFTEFPKCPQQTILTQLEMLEAHIWEKMGSVNRFYGLMPKGNIDAIDFNGADELISNAALVLPSNSNQSQTKMPRRSTSFISQIIRHAEDVKSRVGGDGPNNVGAKFYCICKFKCNSQLQLEQHIKYAVHEGKFECPICLKRFYNFGAWKSHIKSTHSNPEALDIEKYRCGCQKCGEMFETIALKKRHHCFCNRSWPKSGQN